MSKNDLKDMFKEWSALNIKAQESFGQFDFSKIKEIRAKQKKIEDNIYGVLQNAAPANIKSLLPGDCGQLEVGYNKEEAIFYFVMIDPDSEEEDKVKLIAITIDVNKNVNLIKDFEIEDS